MRLARSADFQVCCVAGFQARNAGETPRFADLEIGGTAGLETCATGTADSKENFEEPDSMALNLLGFIWHQPVRSSIKCHSEKPLLGKERPRCSIVNQYDEQNC